MFEIRRCITGNGCDVFGDWRDKLKDNRAKVAERPELNGTHIYRRLSAGGNREMRSLLRITGEPT